MTARQMELGDALPVVSVLIVVGAPMVELRQLDTRRVDTGGGYATHIDHVNGRARKATRTYGDVIISTPVAPDSHPETVARAIGDLADRMGERTPAPRCWWRWETVPLTVAAGGVE